MNTLQSELDAERRARIRAETAEWSARMRAESAEAEAEMMMGIVIGLSIIVAIVAAIA